MSGRNRSSLFCRPLFLFVTFFTAQTFIAQTFIGQTFNAQTLVTSENTLNDPCITHDRAEGLHPSIDGTPVNHDSTQHTSTNSFEGSPWCSFIEECNITNLCDPCRRRFLIVIATARSASTTLQYMLDSLPSVRFGGENGGILNKIYDVYESTGHPERVGTKFESIGPWHRNAAPNGRFACVAQEFVEAVYPPLHSERASFDGEFVILGFKTIRFLDQSEAKDEIMVQFVKENYPCSRIIVNLRSETHKQVKSMAKLGWAKVDRAHIATLDKNNQRLQRIANLFGESQAMLLDSTEWTGNITNLNSAISWLGFNDACHFKKTLQLHINGGIHGKDVMYEHHPNCRYDGVKK